MYKLMLYINSKLSHYNHNKYWKMKFKLYKNSCFKPIRFYYMCKMKRMEAFNCASLGTRLNGGSHFSSIPFFPHGIKGIFISDYVHIGSNCTIFQQVTIGVKDYEHPLNEVPHIGDNVFIGAGAKILGNITIGNNVKIGANAVVTKNVPDNCTVIGNPGIIISHM